MTGLEQHPVTVEIDGESFEGHYTIERRGKFDRLTVWYHGQSLVDGEIAHEADLHSTEAVAEGLLRRLIRERYE